MSEGPTTMRLASVGKVQTLDPVNAKGSGAGYNQYAEPPFVFPNGDLPPKPNLVEDFSISDDGKTYTLTLKQGVTFHDGSEMTAKDVLYSWERLAQSEKSRNKDDIIGDTMTVAHERDKAKTDPKDESTPSDYIAGTLAVRAPDKYTFEFDLATPFAHVFSQIAGGAFAVIPENSVGDIEREGIKTDGEFGYNEFFGTANGGPKFVATGPFKVKSWSKGDAITLEKFDGYHGEGPFIDQITYTVLSSSTAAYKRFLNENLDMIGAGSGSYPTSKFDPKKRSFDKETGKFRSGTYGPMDNGKTVNYGEATDLGTEYILFNCKRTPRYVRRAIAYLMNQQAIATDIYKGVGQVASHLTPTPVFPDSGSDYGTAETYKRHAENGYLAETEFGQQGYPYGIDEARIGEAKKLMEENGHSASNKYKVTFTIFKDSTAYQKIAQRLRDKGTAAHIEMSINKASFGTIIGKGGFGHELDMFSLGDGMEWPESDNFLRFLHPSVASASAGFTQWGRKNDSGEWATKFMRQAEDAWQTYYKPNRGRGEDARAKRDKAYRIIEEMNWASVQELTTIHGIHQRFWYDDLDLRMAGTMENQTYNTARIDRS